MQLGQAKNTTDYIKAFPPAVRAKLKTIRSLVKQLAPHAEETIKYGIPTFVLHGNLVHFAAFKDHIGFFPTASGVKAFKKDLANYDTAKGTIRFPLDKSLPVPLIRKIVKFRIKKVEQNQHRK